MIESPTNPEANLSCWLYVSRNILKPDEAERAVADIVRVSRPRNAALYVTGALLFTGSRFAQLLEGPSDGVRELMASIRMDVRHTDIVTVMDEAVGSRRFHDWSLAYAGPSLFVQGTLEQVLDTHHESPGATARLIELLREFASKASD